MEKYDIIIQAGQSNADGTAKDQIDQLYKPDPKILYLEAEKTWQNTPNGVIVNYADKPFEISVAEDKVRAGGLMGDFSLTFARDYVDNGMLEEGRKVLIIRAAVGATGFKKHNWGMNDQIYLKMIDMIDYALSLNAENRLVALIWHQGEHDAVHGTPPADYKEYMRQLVSSVRERYGEANLPFISGDFVPQWRALNIEKCGPIADMLRELSVELGCSAFVESTGLISNDEKLNNGDTIHFCHQSLYDLGHRYFEAFKDIVR